MSVVSFYFTRLLYSLQRPIDRLLLCIVQFRFLVDCPQPETRSRAHTHTHTHTKSKDLRNKQRLNKQKHTNPSGAQGKRTRASNLNHRPQGVHGGRLVCRQRLHVDVRVSVRTWQQGFGSLPHYQIFCATESTVHRCTTQTRVAGTKQGVNSNLLHVKRSQFAPQIPPLRV